jgi:hypothetical protein
LDASQYYRRPGINSRAQLEEEEEEEITDKLTYF